jgi:hypothetical protein
MVELFNHCIYDLKSKAPSIDTPLHGLLPFKHIDHLHPDALIAIAASKEGEAITKELFSGELAWVPWQRPGFDLGLATGTGVAENPGIRGIVLGGHGCLPGVILPTNLTSTRSIRSKERRNTWLKIMAKAVRFSVVHAWKANRRNVALK